MNQRISFLSCARFILVFIGFILVPIFAHSQDIGDSVMLKESRSGRGIPAHAKPLTKEITFSFQNNSIVTIRKIHLEKTHWLLVEDPLGKTGWIITKYVEGISVKKPNRKRSTGVSFFRLDELGWKIAIIISVFGSFWFFGIRLTLIVSVLWVGWTIFKMGNNSASMIQLAFILGSYALANIIFKKDLLIRELKKDIATATKNYSESTKKQVEKVFHDNPDRIEKIRGKNHLVALESAIIDSQSTLYILSGWVSSSIIKGHIVSLIKKALERGVNTYIGYGYEFKGEHKRSKNAEEALKTLEQIKIEANSRGKLYINEFPNHEKIILVDNKYIICGSNNWLSNRYFFNSENSYKIFDQQLVISEGSRIKELILDADNK